MVRVFVIARQHFKAKPKQSRGLLRTLCVLAITLILSFTVYAAASYDLKEMTPEIQKAISARQARFADLQRLKSEGSLGEDNQGLVKSLKDSTEAAAVVQAENQDRETIYRAIVDQNHLGPSGITEVRSVFAEVQRGKARPGDSIQLRSGEWIQK